MRAFVLIAIVVQAIVAAGCAAHPDPIIDTKGVDPDALAQDWDECEVFTHEIVIAAGAANDDRPSAEIDVPVTGPAIDAVGDNDLVAIR